jgi:hypothetical protein
MKMVSMANKPKAEDKGNEPGGMDCCCDDAKYPYGTQISLGSDQLAALGVKNMPAVGTVVMLQAQAKVVSCRSEEDKDGTSDDSFSLQITDLGLEAAEEKQSPMNMSEAADKIYSK